MISQSIFTGTIFVTLFGCFAIIIGMLVYFYSYAKTCVAPSSCPAANGYYGVTPGHAYYSPSDVRQLSVKQECGTGASPCIETANSLSEAAAYCDKWSDICDVFAYSSETATVYIQDAVNGILNSGNFDLYQSQVAIAKL